MREISAGRKWKLIIGGNNGNTETRNKERNEGGKESERKSDFARAAIVRGDARLERPVHKAPRCLSVAFAIH